MEINLKELNQSRMERCKDIYRPRFYSIHNNKFKFFESPGYLFRSTWNERQNALLEYLLENQSKFKDKNILIMYDGVGLCSIIFNLIGSNVVLCEEKEYWFLIETNIKMNNSKMPKLITPLEYQNNVSIKYDYVILAEPVYSVNSFELLRKDEQIILLGVRKDRWEREKFFQGEQIKPLSILNCFPKGYMRKQITFLRSDQNVIFELQIKKNSWLES
jgi:hypothetical protein